MKHPELLERVACPNCKWYGNKPTYYKATCKRCGAYLNPKTYFKKKMFEKLGVKITRNLI
jgi:ssDNA-binding Zn-finger/Zn-ribbon topoisomerase 1